MPFRVSVLPVLILLLGLWGCAGEPVQLGSDVQTVDNDKAALMPPPGMFAITGVIEQRYGNALQQKIFLSTDSAVSGSNVAEMRIFGTRGTSRFADNGLRFTPLTESRISVDMRAALPSIKMVRSPYVVQNEYGTFGYAMGRPSAGELCMYAWQQMRSTGGSRPFSDIGVIQIRVRLCKAGATEEQLLAFMYGFTITAAVDNPAWNPYGSPVQVPDRLGKTGDPIYPFRSATVLPAVDPATTQSTSSQTVPRKTVAASPQAAIPAPERVPNVVVPSPATASVEEAKPASSPSATAVPPFPDTVVPSPACIDAEGASPPGCP